MLGAVNTLKWYRLAIGTGQIPEVVADRFRSIKDNRELFMVMCDANGSSLLQEIQARGVVLPLDKIKNELHAFVNGRYVCEYVGLSGDVIYNSKMYVGYGEDIVADTTLLSLLDCKCEVRVPKNCFATITLDKDCDVKINIEDYGHVNIKAHKDAKYTVIGNRCWINREEVIDGRRH